MFLDVEYVSTSKWAFFLARGLTSPSAGRGRCVASNSRMKEKACRENSRLESGSLNSGRECVSPGKENASPSDSKDGLRFRDGECKKTQEISGGGQLEGVGVGGSVPERSLSLCQST